MPFKRFFTRQNHNRSLQVNRINENNINSDFLFDFKIDSRIANNILKTINANIKKDVARFGSSVMNNSMLSDISRMNYYINDHKVSVPGCENQSQKNFSDLLTADNAWLQEHVGSLSSFLHQGIFADFFGAVGSWTASNGEKWDIEMVSLDRNHTENDFYIYNTGVVKIISQAKVKNIILKGGDILLADANVSYFSLQLSLCVIRDEGRCIVTTLSRESDRCRLFVKKMGML